MPRLGDPRLLACLAGGIAALGLAPFNIVIATPVGFAGLMFFACQAVGPRAAAAIGFWGGFGYFLVALHWIVEPFLVHAAQEGWMAPFALLGLAAGLALFVAAPLGAAAVLRARFSLNLPQFLGLMILALSIGEYARAYVLTGFPWAMVGHALIGSNLRMLAAIIGGHGMGLILLILAALWSYCLVRKKWSLGGAGVIVALAVWALYPAPLAPVAGADAPLVRVIQPNAAQDQKWRPEMKAFFNDRIVDLTALPVRSAPQARPDLVLYPETVLTSLLENTETIRRDLAEAAGGGMLFLGVQRLDGAAAFNSLVVVDPSGAVTATYDKHHLVPFGEYMPSQNLAREFGLYGLANRMGLSFSSGAGPQALTLNSGLGRVFPMVCYEAIFPRYISQIARPDWMFHATNDAWFGKFSGPYQHLALLQLRATEQGLPVLRAANTGVSAVIDARGVVLSALPMGEMGVIDARLPPPLPPTFYARFGDWAYLVMLLGVSGIFLPRRRMD
ncbi:apolipoprotein N-acyltransferase [Rhodobacteraceae bacterium XHP0102]|nr:apolipoprotein N-acyltransferase [Rhodobacteraceae bacterium XHP0102]